MHEQWDEINERIIELIQEHRTTLIFVNTRRLAERLTHQLTEKLGEGHIDSHHGSLSSVKRLETERKLKTGELKAVVATASLELGIDIGFVDLVIQIGSPRSIATFLQRIGRSGHSLGLVPKGRLFALSRDEIDGMLGPVPGRETRPAWTACPFPRRRSTFWPSRSWPRSPPRIGTSTNCLRWCGGPIRISICRGPNLIGRSSILRRELRAGPGRGRAYLHHDHVGKRLKARKGARLAAIANGGAIPETGAVPRRRGARRNGRRHASTKISPSKACGGDVFLLGNTSWQILHVRGGEVRVRDAHGAPPTIPFWFGEAPGRSLELSQEVSNLREDLESQLADPPAAERWMIAETGCSAEVARQAVAYALSEKAAIGLLPSCKRVVFERFFDETGGMQLVVHAPFGGAINRAWGFAMRKRFCRSFDFELQATADDDGFLLSIGPQHSFPLESLFPMVTSHNLRELLEQAVLRIPMFQVRWRWNVTRALLVLRRRGSQKVPPALQRFRAEDLLSAVFPRLTGCQEHSAGEIELPDHPLARQTMEDCLHEPLDIDGLKEVLRAVERGDITFVARDTREPSPFALEMLNASPYAFLDGGEIQDRRARAVSTPRAPSLEATRDLGRLDAEAISQVIQDAQPFVRDADELHDALLNRIVLPVDQTQPEWQAFFEELASQRRAAEITLPSTQRQAWIAAERLPAVQAIFPVATPNLPITAPSTVRQDWTSVDARVAMVRGLLETCGPTTAPIVSEQLAITLGQAETALEALEGEGIVLRGRFTPSDEPASAAGPIEWCHRRLLARIHRLTIDGLRKQIQPVDVSTFWRFLARHQGLMADARKSGANGLFDVIAMLQGIDAPAVSWERDLLSARVAAYQAQWLDELCLAGEIGWGRLFPPVLNGEHGRPMASITRIAPVSLFLRSDLDWLSATRVRDGQLDVLTSPARHVVELLTSQGAMFAADLARQTQMLPAQLDEALGELVTRGLVTADGFGGLRQLVGENRRHSRMNAKRRRAGLLRNRNTAGGAGRWSLWRPGTAHDQADRDGLVEQWAWQLLRRWGVVFRDLLAKEAGAPGWYDLSQVYRRLEARGEIRGGRFVSGVGGEQFGTADAVQQLRALRDAEPKDELVIISAADPTNLTGIVSDQTRIPSMASNRVAYFNGRPVAAFKSREVLWLAEVSEPIANPILSAFGQPMRLPAEKIPVALEAEPDRPESSDETRDDKRRTRRAYRPPSGIPRPLIR